MLKIAHRGNTEGPSIYENQPSYILTALKKGFDAEVDIWFIDGNLWAGHDSSRYLLKDDFLYNPEVVEHVWFHCKNLEALLYFLDSPIQYKFFWHQNDNYALTNNNIIWTYPGKEVSPKSVIVTFEKDIPEEYRNIFGVCGDYVGNW
jgi:hypothetical protein